MEGTRKWESHKGRNRMRGKQSQVAQIVFKYTKKIIWLGNGPLFKSGFCRGERHSPDAWPKHVVSHTEV